MVIVLRVPESAVEAFMKTASEDALKEEIPNLISVEPIADSGGSVTDLADPNMNTYLHVCVPRLRVCKPIFECVSVDVNRDSYYF